MLALTHSICELKLVSIIFEAVFLVWLIPSYIFDDFPIRSFFAFPGNNNKISKTIYVYLFPKGILYKYSININFSNKIIMYEI